MHKAELSKAEVALWGQASLALFLVWNKSLMTFIRIEHITKWKKFKSRVIHRGEQNLQHAIQDVEATIRPTHSSTHHRGDSTEKPTSRPDEGPVKQEQTVETDKA